MRFWLGELWGGFLVSVSVCDGFCSMFFFFFCRETLIAIALFDAVVGGRWIEMGCVGY